MASRDRAHVALIAVEWRESSYVVDLHEETCHGGQLGVEFACQPAHEAEEQGKRVAFVGPKGQKVTTLSEFLRICTGVALAVDHHAFGNIESFTQGYEDFSSSNDAGGESITKGASSPVGIPTAMGFGAQGAAGAAKWNDLRTGCGGAAQCNQRDASRPCCLLGVLRLRGRCGLCFWKVTQHTADFLALSMAHSMARRLMTWPKQLCPVDMHGVGALTDDFGVGFAVKVAVLDAVEVHGTNCTPCESWPARLALTRISATVEAMSSGAPAAANRSRLICCREWAEWRLEFVIGSSEVLSGLDVLFLERVARIVGRGKQIAGF